MPYVFPTCSGGRCDVRWAALTDARGAGLLATYAHAPRVPTAAAQPPSPLPAPTSVSDPLLAAAGGPAGSAASAAGGGAGTAAAALRQPCGMEGMQLHASRYGSRELADAIHQHELPDAAAAARRAVVVHLDHAHMGLGGDTSWSPDHHPEYWVHADARTAARVDTRAHADGVGGADGGSGGASTGGGASDGDGSAAGGDEETGACGPPPGPAAWCFSVVLTPLPAGGAGRGSDDSAAVANARRVLALVPSL